MGGIRELRGRIKSVGSIKQITRAMEMVATTKLRRFQDRAVASRPYAAEIAALLGRLSAVLGDSTNEMPLFRAGAGEKVAVLVVTSDRGLCGAYNSNVFREVERWVREHELTKQQVDFFVYGRRGYQYLGKRGYNVARFIVEPPLEKVDFASAASTSRIMIEAFLTGAYREAIVVYTAFRSMARFVPTIVPLLPVSAKGLQGEGGASKASGDVILEPSAQAIFDSLVPRFLETRVYNALLESLTSEYASRRFSMKNATDAASDMQAELKMAYNKERQEGITMDLLDIVGGVEAQR